MLETCILLLLDIHRDPMDIVEKKYCLFLGLLVERLLLLLLLEIVAGISLIIMMHHCTAVMMVEEVDLLSLFTDPDGRFYAT